MNIVKGGLTTYGYDVGIIMLDTQFPRIIGDIGNAKSFGYPVLYERVENWKPNKVVLDLNMDDIEPFIDAAKKLKKAGCKVISTSCGFLSLFQKELVERVDATIVTSALLMAPMIKSTISNQKKVCILTANKSTLSDFHLSAVNIARGDYLIYGLENEKTFTNFTVENWNEVDVDSCRDDLLRITRRAMEENDDIGAIILECTNMAPFSKDIQSMAGVPIFDIISLLNFMWGSLNKRSYYDGGWI